MRYCRTYSMVILFRTPSTTIIFSCHPNYIVLHIVLKKNSTTNDLTKKNYWYFIQLVYSLSLFLGNFKSNSEDSYYYIREFFQPRRHYLRLFDLLCCFHLCSIHSKIFTLFKKKFKWIGLQRVCRLYGFGRIGSSREQQCINNR